MRFLRFACLVLSCAIFARARQDFYLKSGDRIVFYGDSTTEQRLYTVFAEAYLLTRFPKLEVKFVTSGWGSDHVTGGAAGILTCAFSATSSLMRRRC